MADPRLRKAEALIRANRKDAARDLLRAVLRDRPGDADAWYLAARASPTRAVAIRNLERALALDPSHIEAQVALAKLETGAPRRPAELPTAEVAAWPAAEAPPARKRQPTPTRRIRLTDLGSRPRRALVIGGAVMALVVIAACALAIILSNRPGEPSVPPVQPQAAGLPTPTPSITRPPSDTPTPGPTATPSVTPTATPSVTPSPTITPSAAPGQREATPYQEPFNRDAEWHPRQEDQARVFVGSGALQIQIDAEGLQIGDINLNRTFADGIYEVETRQLSGNPNDRYGLVVRVSDETGDFYWFIVRGDGFAAAVYCTHACQDGMEPLIDWVPVRAIQQGLGAVNRLRVQARGMMFEYSVNDVYVGRFADTRLLSGRVGVWAAALEPGGLAVAFDNLSVRPLR